MRGPEDQVVKRGSMPRLHCRVKHDPTLKLTVTWLKDEAPLYIGNRSVGNTSMGFLSQDGWTFYRKFQESPGMMWINSSSHHGDI